MYLSDQAAAGTETGFQMVKYEIKPFDGLCPAPLKNKDRVFTTEMGKKGKTPLFYPLCPEGNHAENEISGSGMSPEKEAVLEREAYEKGFVQGERDGLELGRAKADKISGQIEKLLDGIAKLRTELVRHYEKDILEMICAVAHKIVCREVVIDNTAVREAVIKAVEFATEKRSVHIRVNREDFDYIEGIKPELFARFNELKEIIVSPDPGVSRGGCFLETSCGDVDARIETRMDLIRATLENAYAGKPDEPTEC
jgi:flagellar assembly protein FliH